MIFALVLGRVEITPEFYPEFLTSLQYAFYLFSALSVLGIGASLMRAKKPA
jgi:hypothetical protein